MSHKEIQKVASKLLEKSGAFSHIGPAYCLSCGSRIDLDSAIATSNNALLSIKRYAFLDHPKLTFLLVDVRSL